MAERVLTEDDVHEVARAKLVHVLGERRGQTALRETLEQVQLERIETPEQLYTFARALVGRGSFAGAVGGLLTVHALLRGARGDLPPAPSEGS